ncbi:hypothetical protein GCM10009628_35030 [Paeniglutamicibacter kerguelensis]
MPLEERAGAFELPEGVRVAMIARLPWIGRGGPDLHAQKPPEPARSARVPGAFESQCEVLNYPAFVS